MKQTPIRVLLLEDNPGDARLVQAALASCTAQTLRLYANRKGWTLGAMSVEVLLTPKVYATRPF